MDHQESIAGTIDRLLFRSEESGYSIFVLQTKRSTEVIAKGYISTIQPGQHVQLTGAWIMHPKFGRQFEAKQCTATLPASTVGLKKYLGSGMIKGIGKVYAEKLVNRFGADILDIIENHPEKLRNVDGIGEKRLQQITTAWKDQREISTIMIFLQDKGVSPSYATKIYKKYGNESIALVTQNPYRLAEDIWGIGFKSADQIAQQLGFDTASKQRIKAGILFAITQATNNGHLYIELEQLKKQTLELLELNHEHHQTLKIALHELYNQEKIVLLTHDDAHYITLKQYYYAEKGVAGRIMTLMKHPSPLQFDIDAVYRSISITKNELDVKLNEDQQRGIITCLLKKVSIITGGPGTGKTTLIKKLLETLDEYNLTYKLAAPTGRAAKRIIEGTGRHALTVHRLLEFDVSTMSFKHNESNALKLDVLIIDEASMIDIFLAHALLKAIPQKAHVVFIGDINQLPSVAAGNFLRDIIASDKVAFIRLTHIFRQAQNSMIVVNAHRINRGEFPVSSLPEAKKDFIFIKETQPEMIAEHLRSLLFTKLKRYHITPDDTMVLTPMNRGIAGTTKLNQDMQLMLNPEPGKQINRMATVFKVGDKVMQIRNNYDKVVFNGDIGVINDIDVEDRMLTVNFQDRIIEYSSEELDELVLAYAISIHKSQGSEFPAVIIPLFMQHFMLLQRNLIYTALTRAKKLCIIIGEPKALAIAIKNNKGIARTTFLETFLTTDLTHR